MTTAYDTLLASAAPEFVVLAEVQPAEPLGVFTEGSVAALPSRLSTSGLVSMSIASAVLAGPTSAGLSLTAGTNTNLCLVVRVAANATAVTGVTATLNGTDYAMTLACGSGTGSVRAHIWYLLAPVDTAATSISVVGTGIVSVSVLAEYWYNVAQTSTWGTVATSTASTATPSLNVTASTTMAVLDILHTSGGTAGTVGAGQTQDANGVTGSAWLVLASHEDGAASTTMSWAVTNGAVGTMARAAIGMQGALKLYSVAWPQYAQTAVVPGGLYRRLDSVRQNSTALTERASAALVAANAGSYFLDTATDTLWISTTTGSSPNTFALIGAWFTLFFSTSTINFSDRPLYLPLIAGALPTITSEMPDTLFGASLARSGALSLLNADGLFDRLSQQYVWRNKTVTLKLGGAGLAYTDFATVATMRINSVGIDDEVATLSLEDFGTILNRQVPFRTWGDDDLTAATPATIEGAKAAYQPLVFGAISAAPLTLLADAAAIGLGDLYGLYDIEGQDTVTLGTVVAIDRTTGAGTILVLAVDYTTIVGGNFLVVSNATYFHETHEIRATLTNTGSTSTACFGSCAMAILVDCGEDAANIDTAAFTAADTAAPQVLSRFVNQPILAADLMRELEQSVNGQVYRGADGRWTCRVLGPSIPSSYTSLSDADFVLWTETASADLPATVLDTVRVRYANVPATGDWTVVSASDSRVQCANETTDSATVDTWLTDDADAAAHVQHLRFLRASSSSRIEFEERGLTLMGATVGDLVAVTRARAPVARTGAYAGHFLRIVKLTKALGPDVPTVSGVLDDLDGQADHIARCFGSGAAVAWSAATDEQRAVYGFCGDTDRYIDATDALTRDLKVVI